MFKKKKLSLYLAYLESENIEATLDSAYVTINYIYRECESNCVTLKKHQRIF